MPLGNKNDACINTNAQICTARNELRKLERKSFTSSAWICLCVKLILYECELMHECECGTYFDQLI